MADILVVVRGAMEKRMRGALSVWCLHCECAYPIEWFRVNGWQSCPGAWCDGTAADWSPWLPGCWPRDVNPQYPEVPADGGYFPLYPDDVLPLDGKGGDIWLGRT